MKRPTSIAQMEKQTAAFATDEGFAKGLAYQPDPTDIFISPYAKCGTTWMQQIVHGLRTGGDMDFGEITEVVPWIELAHDLNLDIHAPQKARPHAFKSHLGWDEIPKGGRYIVVMRDPVDAFLSFYKFLDGWHFESGSVSLDQFADYVLSRRGSFNYWLHTASWWGQRDNPDVLLLAFEHMKQDLPGAVQQVADFMGDYPEDRVALATKQADFRFMKAHAGQFDDHYLRAILDPRCGLPPDGVSTKVSTGKAGQGKAAVSDEIRARLDAKWAEVMGAQFGLPNYSALLAQMAG
ncbi:sulfotransferase domain-containing protein [Roseovarius sp. 2305UL8-3]|uniref:sulfotransferase domain-containing protein n=1 Tax=Roseovarius conchicola TaxID=3121636 RepID=UPI0035293622